MARQVAHEKYPYVAVWIAIAAIFIAQSVSDGFWQADSDPWMRLAAFELWYQTGDWYNRLVPRINYPFGDSLEWSRPFDLLLAAGTLFFQLFTNHQKALMSWSAIVSPLCGVGVFHGFMKILNQQKVARLYFLISVVLFAATMVKLAPFSIGRADHHGFLMLWYTFSIFMSYQIFQNPSFKKSFWIGWIYGFGLWCSPETLPAIGCIAAFFFCEWLITGKKKTTFQAIFLGLTASTFLCILAEHMPSKFLTIRHDRLSIVHGMLIALTFFTSWLTAHVRIKSIRSRSVFLVGSAVCILGAMQLLYPGFYRGPIAAYATFSPHGFVGYHEYLCIVGELRHASLLEIISHSAMITSLIYFTLKQTKSRYYVFLAINCFAFMIFYFLTHRYIYYYAPAVFLMSYPAFQRLRNYLRTDGYDAIKAFVIHQKEIFVTIVIFMIVLAFWFFWFTIPRTSEDDDRLPKPEKEKISRLTDDQKNQREREICYGSCDTKHLQKYQNTSLFDYIKNEKFAFEKEAAAIMVPARFGPNIVFFTKHRAVGGFYTHNFGIVDTYNFFNTHNLSQIKDIILRRQIKIIAFEYEDIAPQEGAITHQWANGKYPSWVKMLSSPKTTKGPFIYQVNLSAIPGD